MGRTSPPPPIPFAVQLLPHLRETCEVHDAHNVMQQTMNWMASSEEGGYRPGGDLHVESNVKYHLVTEEQLLDFSPTQRQAPEGEQPFGDGAWTQIERPKAARTVLVDLSLGEAVAEVPGSFVGFQTFRDGAVVAGTGGISRVEWSGD